MKTFLQIIIIFLILNSCSNQEETSINNNNVDLQNGKSNTLQSTEEKSKIFELIYVYAVLGSGMGMKGPRFKITENKFLYTRQQNSSIGEFDETIDTFCLGQIRLSSIDSIKAITNQIPKTKIYETNVGVMSGGIDNIIITYEDKKVEFTLHNASHPEAKKIIKIINSNIPKECGKLSLWKDIDEMECEIVEWKLPNGTENE